MGEPATHEIAASMATDVIDLAFALAGDSLPLDHRFQLRDAVVSVLPWFSQEAGAAIHPIKSSRSDEGLLLLSARTRLVLRVPRARCEAALVLVGQVLNVAGTALMIGGATQRALLGHGTVYAHLVCGDVDDETGFAARMKAQMDTQGIRGEVICGRRQTLGAGATLLRGFGVMVHGLAPEASLRLQAEGAGCNMQLGCGIFVPHRSAAAVSA